MTMSHRTTVELEDRLRDLELDRAHVRDQRFRSRERGARREGAVC